MAKHDHLRQYRGRLTPKEVAHGMNAAARNAKRLLADAELLFANGRFPLAGSIAILAIEEGGKLPLLRIISIAPDGKPLADAWKAFRNHRWKNLAWIIIDLFAKGARTMEDLSPMFDPKSDHTSKLDVIKQLGFYVDCCENRHWSEPHEIIDESLARQFISIAKVLRPKRETSEREIELWVKHMGPCWGTPAIKEASSRFALAMTAEGLGACEPEALNQSACAALDLLRAAPKS